LRLPFAFALALGCSGGVPDRIEDAPAEDPGDPAQDVPPDAPPDPVLDAPPAEPDGPVADSPWPDGVTCPNGVCDLGLGEDDSNCPWDCGCRAAASCDGPSPFGCYCDPCCVFLGTCCTDAMSACGPIPPDPCGNGTCDPECESAATCPTDCP
jgi:hypothetical protein